MKLPQTSRNWITIIGSLVAVLNLILIVVLFVVSTILNNHETNLGLFIYIVLPGFLLLGVLMVPVGMILARARIRRSTESERNRLPVVDLNNPRHRNAFVIFTIATIVVLFLSTFGSFEAYHITESVGFCGTLCHRVMQPEYTAHQNSSHANVACVDCHVGSGASWYVKSKISGLRQVYAVLAHTYPTPIPTPLHDLRPARETCEKCHWPQKFYSRTIKTNRYILSDSLNSEWDIVLQMKIGPEDQSRGFQDGIHWHINPAVKVEYVSEHDKRETINYVVLTNKITGAQTIYHMPNVPVADRQSYASRLRTMDCIDCHNRPSHNYNSPSVYFDKAMLTGTVSRSIPFIKQTAMAILYKPFTNKDSAMADIKDHILKFYRAQPAASYPVSSDTVRDAVTAITRAYSENEFPEMHVSHSAYPEHIGHLESDGCFRCHNDQFESADGRKIRRDCNLCHSILGQGNPGAMHYATVRDSLEFRHPVDVGTAWREGNCSECHKNPY